MPAHAHALATLDQVDIYSRKADDIHKRLLSAPPKTTLELWSTGNIRVDGRDYQVPINEARGLMQDLKEDKRFELLDLRCLGEEDDWEAEYRYNGEA